MSQGICGSLGTPEKPRVSAILRTLIMSPIRTETVLSRREYITNTLMITTANNKGEITWANPSIFVVWTCENDREHTRN